MNKLLANSLLVVGLAGAACLGSYCADSVTHAVYAAIVRDEVVKYQAQRIGLLSKQMVAERKSLEDKLADSQRRLDGCRRTIHRYQGELVFVDEQLAKLKGGAR